MDLDKVAVAIRPRNNWEAIDLGFRMARVHWAALYGTWMCVWVGVAVLVHIALAGSFWWALFALWWLKPSLDRVLLIVLSRAVFSAVPSLRGTLLAFPAALKNGLFHSLTFARLDFSRSFSMPVAQLEGLTGEARRQRLSIIKRRIGGAAFWHTVTCWQLEAVVFLGCSLLALWMIPEPLLIDWDPWYRSGTAPEWLRLGANALYVLAVLVVEPFYVAGGFSLYLNRRTVLEGWDIEIAFRRMAPRIAGHKLSEAG